MPRRHFRYNKDLDKFVEVFYDDLPSDLTMVHGDIPAFVSPLDGTVVEGRAAYEEHMRKHNVVPFEPGSEKARAPQKENRQAIRELIWENVDRAIQRDPHYHKRRVRID